MDGKRRQIVEDYRGLLMKNVILSDDFFRTLVTHGVFPQPVVDDIKKAPRGSGQSQLVDMLLTRGNDGFGKFCDVLEVTGHHFLSDCLREAENYEKPDEVDVDDLLNHFPALKKLLKDDIQKTKLLKYFREKVAKEVLKQTWRGDIKVKEQLMIARQKQIEQVWHFEEETKIKEKSMQELQVDYVKLQAHCDSLRREIKSLHKHVEDLERKHKEELRTQMDFNMANDRHLTRLNVRAEEAGDVLAVLHDKLRSAMSLMYNDNERVHAHQNLLVNFDSYMSYNRGLADKYRRFRDERVYVASHIGASVDDDAASIKHDFRDFVVRKEEEANRLAAEIEALRADVQQKAESIEQLRRLQERIAEEQATGGGGVGGAAAAAAAVDRAKYEYMQKELDEKRNEVRVKEDRIKAVTAKLRDVEQRVQDLEAMIAALRDQLAAAAKNQHNAAVHQPPHHHQKQPHGQHQHATVAETTIVSARPGGAAVQLDPIVRPRSPGLNGSQSDSSLAAKDAGANATPPLDKLASTPRQLQQQQQQQAFFHVAGVDKLHARFPGAYATDLLAPLEAVRGQQINGAAVAAAAAAQLDGDADFFLSQTIGAGAGRQRYKFAGQSGLGIKVAQPIATAGGGPGTAYSKRQLATRAVKTRKGV